MAWRGGTGLGRKWSQGRGPLLLRNPPAQSFRLEVQAGRPVSSSCPGVLPFAPSGLVLAQCPSPTPMAGPRVAV